ncbi:hypothetical protein GQ55_3G290100 [Panicum hallii var. hallii]|uniref:Cysteine-rich transmembrane domain-containing protein n=2 Tax=Panicum hallii TaxID=206008 RepID=A0A2T7EEH1_9POAL|nr:hypothetical protein PAHAL_3G301500 [Panicum hallii]PUZ66226.1 hypothetical protein GQ55_3G290100 [Panicum hallii var. hallii]
MENNGRSNPQPPPGYPTVAPDGGEGKKKGSRRASTTKRGEASFIEGCIAALCCCWICDLCCN